MKDPYRAREPSISIAYLQLLLEILAERGFAAATLLEGIPIDPALLDDSQARMSPTQWTRRWAMNMACACGRPCTACSATRQ